MKIYRLHTTCLLALLALLGCSRVRPRETPPIVLISIDTLRADHLGCYGYERETSPNIDALAREGVFFEEAISQAPVTAPSHMSMLTSLYPPVHLIANYSQGKFTSAVLDENITTLPQFLQEYGYLTIGLTGGAQIDGERGFARGFDYYGDDFLVWENNAGKHKPDPDDLQEVGVKIREAIRQSKREGKPLFLFLHHYLCHDPYLKGPEEMRQKFLDSPVPGLVKSPDEIDYEANAAGVREQFAAGADPENPEHFRHYIALYDGGIYISDLVFKNIMAILQEEGIADEALIIVTSDHGEEFYEHLSVFHFQLFREVLHVPLIMRFPHNRYGGRRISQPVRLIDIFPTIADYLGLEEVLPRIQGESLLAAVTQGKGYRGKPLSFSEDCKAVRFTEDGYTYSNHKRHHTDDWLFSRADTREKENLAGENQDLVEKMRNRASDILAATEDFRLQLVGDNPQRNVEASQERLRELRALGYIN